MRWSLIAVLLVGLITACESATETPTESGDTSVPSKATSIVATAAATHPLEATKAARKAATSTLATADVAIATPNVAPVETSIPAPPPIAAVPIEFVDIPSALVGGLAAVTIRTDPDTSCSIRYRTPSGTDSAAEGLYDKTSGADGMVSWEWTIGPATNPGTGGLFVSCGGATAEAEIEITE